MTEARSTLPKTADVHCEIGDDHVAALTLSRPPDNTLDPELADSLATALEALDSDDRCRAVLLRAEGRHFCAGAALRPSGGPVFDPAGPHLYDHALRLFATTKPIVAAVRGAAVGGGLGLALAADLRVGTPSTRMAANFARLGFHHGFALTETLPAVVGQQAALDLLYTGRRLDGEQAARIGLLDRLVDDEDLDRTAREWAAEIAASAPLALQSIRKTMRGDLLDRASEAMRHERAEQRRLRETADYAEGVRAYAQRRPGRFRGC